MIEEEMVHQQCISCGVHWMQPKYLNDRRRQDKATFYCPNGHAQAYTQSEADKLRLERDRLKQREAMLEDEKREAIARAERAEAATNRLKKRTAAGTCPCCQRTFSNMNTHMRKQHPQFVAEQVVVPLKRA